MEIYEFFEKGIAFFKIHARMNVRPPLGAQKYIPQGGNISWLITLPMLASSAAPAPSSAPPKQSRKPNSSEFRTACPASCRCRPFLITLQTLYEYVGSLTRPVTFFVKNRGNIITLRTPYEYVGSPTRPVTFLRQKPGARRHPARKSPPAQSN